LSVTHQSERAETDGSRKAGDSMAITITRKLLTASWVSGVDTVETAIRRFRPDKVPANDCQIVFFEIAGDERLHVNVTHQKPTRSANGWAGPARVAAGFVHNRTFGDVPPKQMIRHIRQMAFA
jgi:hypothetical protein